MEKPVTKRMLFDFFSEKTTAMQRKLIEEWLREAGSQELYYQYLDEWERENPQFFPDLDKAAEKYEVLLNGGVADRTLSADFHPKHKLFASLTGMWYQGLVAAGVLLITAFIFKKDLMYKSLQSPLDHSSSHVLGDGTQVLLNANSKLLIPRFGFGDGSREVELEGEADFNVTHTRSSDRFIVHMGDHYEVEVLGTQFVAYSRKESKHVFLSQGKVKLSLPEGKQVYMKPGNLFTLKPNGSFDITVPLKPQKYTAWKEQLFYFDNTALSDVVRQMRERFAVDVRISDTVLLGRRIGGIYRAEHTDDLLQILSDLLQLEVIQNPDHIELRIKKTQ